MAESDDFSGRLDELKLLWESDPTAKVYLQLAEEYRRLGQVDEAIRVLEKTLTQRPRDPRGRVLLARCRMDRGEFAEASRILEEVARLDPAHAVASKLLLETYLQLHDAEKASERYNLYRLLNDRDPELDHLEFRLRRLVSGEAIEDSRPVSQPVPSTTSPVDLSALASFAPQLPQALPLAAPSPKTPEVPFVMPQAPVVPSSVAADLFDLSTVPAPRPQAASVTSPFDWLESPKPATAMPTPLAATPVAAPSPASSPLPASLDAAPIVTPAPIFPSADQPFGDWVKAPAPSSFDLFEMLLPTAAPSPAPSFEDFWQPPVYEAPAPEIFEAPPVFATPAPPTPEPEPWVAPPVYEAPAPEIFEAPPVFATPAPPTPEPEPWVAPPVYEAPTPEPFEAPAAFFAPSVPATPEPELWVAPPVYEAPVPEAFEVPAVFSAPQPWGEPAALPTASAVPEPTFELEPAAPSPAGESADLEASATLGDLYLLQGHVAEAETIYQKVLRRDPTNATALAGLQRLKALQSDFFAPPPSSPAPPAPTPPPEVVAVPEPVAAEPVAALPVAAEPVAALPVAALPVAAVPVAEREEVPTPPRVEVPLTAAFLLARRGSPHEIPAGLTAKKILVLRRYLQHLRSARPVYVQ